VCEERYGGEEVVFEGGGTGTEEGDGETCGIEEGTRGGECWWWKEGVAEAARGRESAEGGLHGYVVGKVDVSPCLCGLEFGCDIII
jgi:hypothetical protein